MTTILIVAGATLLASFLCSLFEAALYTITPAQVGVLKDQGVWGSARLARLRADVEEPIAAILTVNTIAHTVGAAWCGAQVGKVFGEEYGEEAAVAVFSAIFTVLVLAVTEIVPKSVGVRYANSLASFVAWPIQFMVWSVWPVVWIAKKAMHALTGGGGPKGPSEDEVVVMTGLAASTGGVRSEEHQWVRNALTLDQLTAGGLRTPRTVVESLPAHTRVGDLAANPRQLVHSRVPVTEDGDTDQLVGLVHRREVFDAALADPDTDLTLRDLLRPIDFVPEAMPAHELLSKFLKERTHMVAVADEYGGFEGLVTLEDVLEELLGDEIVDEHDLVPDMQQLALRRARERSEGADESAGEPRS